MTAVAPAGPPSITDRVAAALGWTPGQVWTVALGLLVAVPAGIFGLGPTLDAVPTTPSVLAAPAPASAPGATTPPAVPDAPADAAPPPLPSILGDGPPALGPPDLGSVGPPPNGGSGGVTPPPPIAGTVGPLEIPGPGEVTAVAAAADAVAVAVDRGADQPGAVVVVDRDGRIAATIELVADGVTYRGAGGVAVVEQGVVVTTTSPAAVLLVEPVAEHVEQLAVVPDLPTCVPIAREEDCQPGVDAAPDPGHVAAGADGVMYVVDRAQACVFRVAGASIRPWLCDVVHSPSPAIDGTGLRGIAVADGRVVITSRVALEAKDVVETIVIEGDAPGARSRRVELDSTEQIDGVDVLDDGSVVAALTGSGTLLVVPPDAPEAARRIVGFVQPVDVAARGEELAVAERTPGTAGTVRAHPAAGQAH